jgi:hypothetical protein
MANTSTAAELVVTKFLSDFFKEFIRGNRFSAYTGTSNNNVICIKEGRKRIEIPLVARLKGNGAKGSQTLRGSGEAIGNYGLLLTPTYYRHAVEFDKEEMEKPNIDLMRASKDLLLDWSKEQTRDQMIEAFCAVYNGTSYANYGDAAAGDHDAWLVNNSDRVLYGLLTSNQSAGNHTASLANVDASADKMGPDVVELARSLAEQADAHIRPLHSREDEDGFVMFCDPYAFRDFAKDSTVRESNREARARGISNPLFKGGDLMWNDVIVRKVPEIAHFIDGVSGADGAWGAGSTADDLTVAGASSTRVGVSFLCGQQALSWGLGQRPKTIIDRDFDYGFQPGCAIEFKQDIQKSYFDNRQHGVVTVFTSSATN